MNMQVEMKSWIDSVETKLAGVGVDVNVLREHLAQIEAKSADKPGGGMGGHGPSFGAQLAASDKFKSFQSAGYQGSARVSLKAITAAQTGTAWSARDTTVDQLARRTLRIRDLLTVIPTTAGSIDYAKQVTRTNNAAVVAEGTQKPTSTYVWQQVNAPVRTIAHLAKITRQAMDDAAQLAAEVENEMRYGLGLAEEGELLTGDGTGEHLTGLIPNATGYVPPFQVAAPNMIDIIGLAILKQSLTEFATDGVIMHPSDWTRIRLLKNTQGEYLLGDPGADVPPRLFGLPVVPSQAMTADTFLVGGFKIQKLYDRMTPEVLIASENATDFETNLYTMRCEERLALTIRQPTALVFGDFSDAITASTAA